MKSCALNICDRCEKSYAGGGTIFKSATSGLKMDLCPKCTAKLYGWLESKKPKKENNKT